LGDVVTNDGAVYMSLQNHTSSALNEPPNITYWAKIGGGGASGGLTKTVTQAGHGLSVGDAVYYTGTQYAKAISTPVSAAEFVGIVSTVDGDVFEITLGGEVTIFNSLTAGSVYFLSETSAGQLSLDEPTTEGSVSKPVLISTAASAGFIFNWRGTEITKESTSYFLSFTNLDLSDNILTVNHNFGHKYTTVQIYDNNDKLIVPDEVTLSNINSLTVNVSSYGEISGTWHAIALDHGSVSNISMPVSGSQPSGVYSLSDGETIEIDWNNGATQYVTLGSTGRTVTSTNAVSGHVYRLIIIQGSGGSKTITTWPTTHWSGKTEPVLSTTEGSIDIVTWLCVGSNLYGDCSIDFGIPA